jgi:Tol biopolymer transport system component
MLYEMATGKRPFRGETTTDTLAKILESEPEPPSAVSNSVLPGIEPIITRCLKKHPADRYDNTQDLVAELRDLQLAEASGGVTAAPSKTRLRRIAPGLAVALILLVPALILLWRWSGRPPPASSEIKATRVAVETFGCEIPPIAISPDGRFLAYTNKSELILSAIGSGEVKTLLQLEGVRYYWWIDWHPDGDHILTEEPGNENCETWLTNILTGKREPLHQTNEASYPSLPTISPDGQSLAYLWDKRREIRIRPLTGGESSVVVRVGEHEELSPAVWAPGGTRLAYSVLDMSYVACIHHPLSGERHIRLETTDLTGKRSVLIEDAWINWSPTGVERPCWLPDGRLVYTRQTTMGISEFFVIDVDLGSGQPTGGPRKFFRIDGPIDFDLPAAAADGQRLAFVRTENHPRLMLLENTAGGNASPPRQVSIDEWPTYPGVWSADGQRIFCSTERQPGNADIYVHDLDSQRAVPFVVTVRYEVPQCLTPDGSNLLYLQDRDLMAIPTAGGVSRLLFPIEGDHPILGVRCARSPDSTCVVVLRDELELVLRPFQLAGKLGSEILRVEIGADQSSASGFDISPTGEQVVFTETNGRIRVFDLRSGESRQLPNVSGGIPKFVNWSPTKKSIYLAGLNWKATETVNYWVGRLDLEGGAEFLWGSNDMWAGMPVPSPDGNSVIFHGLRWETDIWMIEGF